MQSCISGVGEQEYFEMFKNGVFEVPLLS